MIRKLFLLALFVMFYFWIMDSKENTKKFKDAYQFVVSKLSQLDFDIHLSSKSKKKKW